MSFKLLFRLLLICVSLFLLSCSDEAEEQDLVDLHITASEDVISIEIPLALNETVLSIDSEFNFSVQGLKSNGVDHISLTDHVEWSLSAGAASSIDQHGLFLASANAEEITLTAKFGLLVTSVEIRVSDAKFDRVDKLHNTSFSIYKCQSQVLQPDGRYENDNGVEEIRAVDSNTIQTIEWAVFEADGSPSKRAYVETTPDNQVILHTLRAGELDIRATAPSILNETEETVSFEQSVSNGIYSLKLCLSDDTDLEGCQLNEITVQQDAFTSLKAIAKYQATDGTYYNENITRNSQWIIEDAKNASIAFSTDRQQLDVTGVTEGTNTNLTAACGIDLQALENIDITEGVILEEEVNCDADCEDVTAKVNVDLLDVLSFEVTVNENVVSDDTVFTLESQPTEISLVVQVNFSNNELETITDNPDLTYVILSVEGQLDIIEKTIDSENVFTVLGAGTAKVLLTFRGEIFTVVIEIPEIE